MAGFRIVTDLDAEKVLNIGVRVAEREGFHVLSIRDEGFTARRGNLPLSILVGAFVAYCDFTVHVERVDQDAVELFIERNRPWWTGVIGVNRVRNAARALSEKIADEFHQAGGRILEEKEI